MKKHNGMRPQDIVVLLRIISMQNQEWRNIDIANALNLSPKDLQTMDYLRELRVRYHMDQIQKEHILLKI
jgi:hypothetical protein